MRHWLVVMGVLVSTSACLQSAGTMTVSASGESAAVEGYAAEDFADGWAISFDRVLVAVQEVHAALPDDDTMREDLVVNTVFDLAAGDVPVAAMDLTAERYNVGYQLNAPTDEAETEAGVDDDELGRLIDGGDSVLIEGTGEKDGRVVPFSLSFPLLVEMTDCDNGIDDTQGVVVEAQAETPVEITMHLDHIFNDQLGDHTGAELRFDAWANAVGDGEVVTKEVLENVAVSDLGDYNPRSVDVFTLYEFVATAASTMPHFNGEGSCTIRGL